MDIFLNQLSNSDIQWLKQNGRSQQIETGNISIEQARFPNFYLLIRGELVGSISQNQGGRLGRAFAALEEDVDLEQEIVRFSPGDVLGHIPAVELTAAMMTIRATENSTLLSVSGEALRSKIAEDIGFAARFYRAIAMLLLERFSRLVKYFLRPKMGQVQPLQDVPLIFGELSDSDVDWMLGAGRLTEIENDRVLIRAGDQIEDLYIVLQGTLSLFIKEEKSNRLFNIFAALESDTDTNTSLGREIVHLNRGEIIGEAIALDNPISTATVRALENSILLRIPQQQLLLKLQQDVGAAARFYRVESMLLSSRLQGLISRLGYGRTRYEPGQSLDPAANYEDELDLDMMDNLTLGGARFDWMLKRLTV
jgi:bacteriocin-type transport-associated protein